jgi:hypothetical protein
VSGVGMINPLTASTGNQEKKPTMKRCLIILVLLLCSPALFACEACLTSGTTPAGNPVYQPICWSGLATGDATCIPRTSGCDTTTDSVCTGGGGRGAQQKDPVGGGFSAPSDSSADCSADVSGTCSGTTLEAADSFLG